MKILFIKKILNIFLISMSISISASDQEMSASDKEIAREYLNKLYSATSNEHILEESSADIPEQPSSDISEEQPTDIPEEPRANKPKSSVVKNNFTAPIQNPIEGANIMDDPWLLGKIPFKPNNSPNIPLPEDSMLRFMTRANPKDPDCCFWRACCCCW